MLVGLCVRYCILTIISTFRCGIFASPTFKFCEYVVFARALDRLKE